jgi:hypothetical protein
LFQEESERHLSEVPLQLILVDNIPFANYEYIVDAKYLIDKYEMLNHPEGRIL